MYGWHQRVGSFLMYARFIYNINKIQLWGKQYSKATEKIYTRIWIKERVNAGKKWWNEEGGVSEES